MSMSMSLVGFKPADAKFRKMKAAWDACRAAGVEVSPKVLEYFGDQEPPDNPDLGVEVDLDPGRSPGVSEYKGDMEDGIEVDLRLLPPDVKVLRFVCSY